MNSELKMNARLNELVSDPINRSFSPKVFWYSFFLNKIGETLFIKTALCMISSFPLPFRRLGKFRYVLLSSLRSPCSLSQNRAHSPGNIMRNTRHLAVSTEYILVIDYSTEDIQMLTSSQWAILYEANNRNPNAPRLQHVWNELPRHILTNFINGVLRRHDALLSCWV